MQTLGLGPSNSRSDSRIKSLFWPGVANQIDVDYLTTQGFWLCFIVAAMTFVVSVAGGTYSGTIEAIFFYLGGNGVRQRSKIAAVCVFVVYSLESILMAKVMYAGGGSGQIRLLTTALLLSNVRAIWIAASWHNTGDVGEVPAALTDSFADKLTDRLPEIIWPKGQYVFYLIAALMIISILFALFGVLPGAR